MGCGLGSGGVGGCGCVVGEDLGAGVEGEEVWEEGEEDVFIVKEGDYVCGGCDEGFYVGYCVGGGEVGFCGH